MGSLLKSSTRPIVLDRIVHADAATEHLIFCVANDTLKYNS